MQLSSLLPLVLLPAVQANFHIGVAKQWTNPVSKDGKQITTFATIACPSNYLNCNCYGQIATNADRGVGSVGNKRPTGSSFSMKAGLCGMGQLDFYYRSDRRVWEFYVHNGDGGLQGTCYSSKYNDKCLRKVTTLSTDYDDALWCDSYICGN